MSNYIFVDVEAVGISPVRGTMTEFGAVHEKSLRTFHGILFEGTPDPENPAIPVVGKRVASDILVAVSFEAWLKDVCGNDRPIFVSDNVAYDWMWIAGMFDRARFEENPFGHSGRRISDFWAGLNNNWGETQSWKDFRETKHDHMPVNDAMGNVEAFQAIKEVAKQQRSIIAGGCPCGLVEPCSANCTCFNGLLSGGCLRCCKYGPKEQRLAAAKSLAKEQRDAATTR